MGSEIRNIILIIAEVIICYTTLILLSKKYKTDGIYVYAVIATFTACIMSLKEMSLMNVSVPIGFGVTTSLIIALADTKTLWSAFKKEQHLGLRVPQDQ